MFHIEKADYASASLVQQSSGSEQNVITLIYVQNFPSYHLICIPLSLSQRKKGDTRSRNISEVPECSSSPFVIQTYQQSIPIITVSNETVFLSLTLLTTLCQVE